METQTIITIKKQDLVRLLDGVVMRAMHRLPRKRREYYTKRETCELFGVTFETVLNWDKLGKLTRCDFVRVAYTAESVENLYISRNL